MVGKKKRNQYEFDKCKYDHIHLQIPKGQKATLQAAADQARESVNEYANKALLARMGREEWSEKQEES